MISTWRASTNRPLRPRARPAEGRVRILINRLRAGRDQRTHLKTNWEGTSTPISPPRPVSVRDRVDIAMTTPMGKIPMGHRPSVPPDLIQTHVTASAARAAHLAMGATSSRNPPLARLREHGAPLHPLTMAARMPIPPTTRQGMATPNSAKMHTNSRCRLRGRRAGRATQNPGQPSELPSLPLTTGSSSPLLLARC